MSRIRYFRKCLICGTHGHPRGLCPVHELNMQQEAVKAHKDAAILLGLTPALEAEIALIRHNWYAKIHLVTA